MAAGKFSKDIFPGARFGMLTVIHRIPSGQHNRAKVLCRCDCGKETSPNADSLKKTKSCGCQRYGKARPPVKVKIGETFVRLTVISIEKGKGIVCRCVCGNIHRVADSSCLRSGTTKSCGCLASETTITRNKTSGKFDCFSSAHPKTYQSWSSMKQRCCNTKCRNYPQYGGVGVQVCAFLKDNPQNLVKVIGHSKKDAPTLDRSPIHNGNYTCGQCIECYDNGWKLNIRWASRKEQSLNRGTFNVYITAFGKTLTKSQWMELSGLGWKCLTGRLRRGWDVEKALTTPDTYGNKLNPNVLETLSV